MSRDDVLKYIPSGTQVFGYGVDPGRVLTKKERGMVLTRLREWAEGKVDPGTPTPSLVELRWSDDLGYLYVDKTSGLLEWGFDSVFPEHAPVHEGEHFAIYPASNPAAHCLLTAIEEVWR